MEEPALFCRELQGALQGEIGALLICAYHKNSLKLLVQLDLHWVCLTGILGAGMSR